MADCKKLVHPFQNDPGTSQRQRVMDELLSGDAKIDARTLADLLNYFVQFSAHINYYDKNLNISDWQPFFKKSLPFTIASIIKYDAASVNESFDLYNALFSKRPSTAGLQLSFYFIYYKTIRQFNNWYVAVKDSGLPIENILRKLISENLRAPLAEFICLMNIGVKYYCVKKIDIGAALDNDVWGLNINEQNFNDDDCLQVNKTGKAKGLPELQKKVKDLFTSFIEAVKVLSVTSETADSMQQALLPLKEELQKTHTPHLGLLFAFLKIFGKLQEDLNGYGKKHLDFFYTEVLKLKPNGAVPDKAHIIFELQKQLKKHALAKGLLLKDGKDDNKEEILFALDDEIVVNQTQVAELRTLFVNNQLVYEKVYVEGVYMAPKADKADGEEKDFKDPGPKNYPTLGAKYSKYIEPEQKGFKPYPHARIGFILASPVLLLNEGTRTIDITLACQLNENCTLVNEQDDGSADPCCEGNKNTSTLKESCKSPVEFVETKKLYNKIKTIFFYERDGVPLAKTYIYISEVLVKDAGQKGINEELINKICIRFLKDECNVSECCNDKIIYKTDTTVFKNIWDVFLKENQVEKNEMDILSVLFRPRSPFKILFSGEKEWVEPEDTPLVTINENANSFNIIISAVLNPDKPAVTFYDAEKLKEDFNTKQPLVKIELDDKVKIDLNDPLLAHLGLDEVKGSCCLDKPVNLDCRQLSLYHFFRNVNIISGTQIEVTVCGLKNFVVQNDEGVQDVSSPFPAFGSRPKVESNFYIGCEEIFLKKWSDIIINHNWKDLPVYSPATGDFADKPFKYYYNGYQDFFLNPPADPTQEGVIEDGSFRKQIFILQDGNWVEWNNCVHNTPSEYWCDAVNLKCSLFQLEKDVSDLGCSDNINYSHQYTINRSSDFGNKLDNSIEKKYYHGYKKLDVNSRYAFIKVVLKCQDFQHDRYPFILGRQMSALGKLPEIVDGAVYFNIDNANDLKIVDLDKILSDILYAYEVAENPALNAEIIRQKITFFKSKFHDGTGTIDDPNQVNDKFFADINKPHLPSDPPPTPYPDLNEALVEIFDILKTHGEEIKGFKNKGVVIPNAPWTPIIQNISLDYKATATIEDIDLIHLYPYTGTYKHVEIQLKPSLLPVFCDEGTLFIALKDLEPGSNVNILFQLAEATADSESERETVHWQYLDNNQWKNLRKGFEVLDDATNDLTTSGIIKFALPGNISTGNSVMPKDFYWIKAAVRINSLSVSELIGIHTQAMLATFTNTPANDKLRLAKPLAAGAVSKLEVADAGIKKVDQPYGSFDGMVPEREGEGNYYVRVSELLRHKGRAIQKFDYERIALQAFPQLYKVKCINHSFALNAHQYINDFPMAPGYVILAVIPDLNKLKAGGSFEPKVPVSILEKIEAYLRLRTSPFVRLRAMNPRYEKINFCLTVKLVKGRDENFYKEKMKQDLREFLAPWAIGEYSKLCFGQKVSRAGIIGFLESKEYVDYIIDFKMGLEVPENSAGVSPVAPRSILIAGEIDVCIHKGDCEKWRDCNEEIRTVICCDDQ